MNTQIQLKRTTPSLFVVFALLCFALAPTALADPTNTSLGVGALPGNTTGSFNTGIGYNAMNKNSTGDGNVAVVGLALRVQASTRIVVNSTADTIGPCATTGTGTCTLRDAITFANSINEPGPESIEIAFDLSIFGQTITLGSPLPAINTRQIISGDGRITISGNNSVQIMTVNKRDRTILVIIQGLIFANGHSGGSGGAILNNGNLHVDGCTFSGNTARGGGAIRNDGLLDAFATTFTGNTTFQGLGGAIFNTGALRVRACTFNGNTAISGGAIYNNAEFTGPADVAIVDSTFSGNSAHLSSGVIDTDDDAGPTRVSIDDSTFSGNSAPDAGIAAFDGANVTVANTILNAGASGANLAEFGRSMITSHGYNLSSDNGGGFLTKPGDRININPQLGPLANNGGPTLTHALLPGSPAIDAGDPQFNPDTFNPPLRTDQRFFNRIVNGRIDIGAFEVQAPQ
jgi:CSLREA domain-containing protein